MAKKHFIVRCLGHRAQRLRPGQSIKIGRHESNDIVLASGTVSRFHATLVWNKGEDRPYVEDNESANGIEVDSNPIDCRSYLTGSDNQLEIGDFVLVLSLRGAEEDTAQEAGVKALLESDHQTSDGVRLFSERGEALNGRFKSLRALQRILLQVEEEERTGTLKLRVGARMWAVTFAQGKIMTATFGDEEGMTAIYSLLAQPTGKYEFTREIQPSETSLNLSPLALFAAETGQTRTRMDKSRLTEE
ncbi:MAG: FHA domain-containing protein [Planctomycetes bacterium]|nr:FHA domain-containing protein [Planctomycetota bacterium]